MEQTVFPETLAYKNQTPVNHPEESIQHSEHREILKSRIFYTGNKFITLSHETLISLVSSTYHKGF
jgi:hypothetical protein